MKFPALEINALANADESIDIVLPLPTIKKRGRPRKDGSTIMSDVLVTLNTANSSNYRALMKAKHNYKDIIYYIIKRLKKFDSGHLHFVYSITYNNKSVHDNDNMIFITKWLQDSLVEIGKLNDDKDISFTFLPAKNNIELDESICEVSIIDLNKNKYFEKLKEENEK